MSSVDNSSAATPSEVPKTRRPAAKLDPLFGLLAPTLLLSFAVGLGGFQSGSRALPTAIGVVVLALVAVLGACRSPLDPLGLSEDGSRWARLVGLLPWLVVVWVVGSWWISPVPRAGRMFLLYGPWLLLMVPAVRYSLATEARRRIAETGFSLAVMAVASWALFDWLMLGSPRAAMPLGHHNLLALWLVAVLPMAALPAIWRDGESLQHGTLGSRVDSSVRSSTSSRARKLGTFATAMGVLALLGTKSLAGAVGLCVQLLWIVTKAPGPQGPAVQKRRVVFGVLSSGAILLAVGWRRFAALLGQGDQSMEARWLYLRAGVEGWLERPLFGWGPGASSWTLGLHLDRGKLPVHQIVTDTHSLVFDLLYEVGMVGLGGIVLLGLLWCRARRKEDRGSRPCLEAGAWRSVSEVPLVGLGVMTIGAGFFDVMAVWILVPVMVGLRGSAERGTRLKGRPLTKRETGAVLMVVCLLGFGSVGPLRSQFAYERAITASDPAFERAALEQAVRLDAAHPLTRFEKARLQGEGKDAFLAARQAHGLSPLFLGAGYLLRESEEGPTSLARQALGTACDLAVGDPMAPFFLATLQQPGTPPFEVGGLQAMARALVAEPRLLATPELLARPDVREAAVMLLEQRVEIPLGWRSALVESESRLPNRAYAVTNPLDLVLFADQSQETSLALFAFRRMALRTVLARLTLDETLASAIAMPPAADLDQFDPRLFAEGCRLSTPG